MNGQRRCGTYDPAIPLLGVYPEKTIIQKDTCTPTFIAALFTIAKTGKQSECPSTDEWIQKMWYTALPGSPVVRTWPFHCCGPGFNPWSGNKDPASREAQPKKKEEDVVHIYNGILLSHKKE